MAQDSVHSPANSIWGKLSVSFVGIGCVVFLSYCFYKFFRNHCLVFGIGYQRNDPEDPSLEFRSIGLAAHVVNSLQAVQYTEEEEVKKGSDCAICLAEFGEGEWLRVLPSCDHAFHLHCIDAWLCSHLDCPLCRKRVLGDACSFVPVSLSFETLPREDISRDRPLGYRLLEPEAMRNEGVRSEARGIQRLVWL